MNNKEKILKTALELFNEKGSQGVTTNHIAKAAGVSPGNLYYHFKNKEAILLTLFQEMECCFDQLTGTDAQLPIPSLEAMDRMFAQVSEAEWEYRFFSREMVTLVAQEGPLKELFLQKQKERLVMIEASIRGLISLGLAQPLDEETIGRLTQVVWLLSAFWNSYLSLSGEQVTREKMAEGMKMVRLVVQPFLLPPKAS